MKDLGNIIAQRRKSLGISQEELAAQSGVSLRTIQRIESGISEPHGDTLRRICEALRLEIEDLYEYSKTDNPQFLVLMYLAVLLYILIPLGNVILPLIMWVFNKNKIAGVNQHGRIILNFQLTWASIFYAPFVLVLLSRFLHMDLVHSAKFSIWQFVLLDLVLMSLVNFAFIACGAIQAYRGKVIRVISIPFLGK